MVQLLYDQFAKQRKTSGDPVYVFWDSKCLNFGQNWEQGFLQALKNSRLIVLLVSMKVGPLYCKFVFVHLSDHMNCRVLRE